jgi:HK97 family phage prohead protease
MQLQRLNCPLIELKFDGGGDAVTGMRFQGYGSVFNNIDQGGDVVEPGAFASFLSEMKAGTQPWPAMLAQHGAMMLTAEDITPIGSWVDLKEDGVGLSTEGELADTPRGNEYYKLMKMQPRPAINGMSIGYIAKQSEPRSKPEDPRRRLKKIDLVEISLVTRPMNRKALVTGVKSIEELATLTDVEDLLRDAGGFSRKEAQTLISRIKGMGGSDSSSELSELAEMIRRNTSILNT